MIKNLFISVDKKYTVNKKLLHKIVGKLKNDLGFLIASLELNIIDNLSITELNAKYLNHAYSTDIITFKYSGDNKILDGEVFISVDDARSNAKKYRCSVDEEILRLLIHGVLHMLGYDDIQADKKKEMKKIENYLVEEYRYIIRNDAIIYDG